MQFIKHPTILEFSGVSLIGTAYGSGPAEQGLIAAMILPACRYKHRDLL
ncbi:MAG: hypothetical protein KJP11_01955 [Gammaproteobacteria bacterium]|nr:hypothetical protein [Gammaproteobacteria bacterium]